MAVNYDKGAPSIWLHFYPKAVVRSTADGIVTWLQSGHYRRLVFIGSSMGGLLAWDIQQELGNKLKGVRVDMIALDAPTERGDFQSPNDTLSLAMYLSWGPWLNKLDLVPKLIIKSPDEDNIEEGVDQQKLQASVEIAQSFQMSFNRDQVKYILTHGGPTDGSLDVRRFVYVRSTRDDNTVRPEAVEGWRHTPVRSDAFSEFFVDSTHVGFSERPETWKTAFVELFEQELDFEPAV